MTVAQARQRLLSRMPAGSKVEIEHQTFWGEKFGRGDHVRTDWWRFSILMPRMDYWNSLHSGLRGTLRANLREAEQHLIQYVKYRAARQRRLDRERAAASLVAA